MCAVKGQLVGVNSLLLQSRSWWSDSDSQAWPQAFLPDKLLFICIISEIVSHYAAQIILGSECHYIDKIGFVTLKGWNYICPSPCLAYKCFSPWPQGFPEMLLVLYVLRGALILKPSLTNTNVSYPFLPGSQKFQNFQVIRIFSPHFLRVLILQTSRIDSPWNHLNNLLIIQTPQVSWLLWWRRTPSMKSYCSLEVTVFLETVNSTFLLEHWWVPQEVLEVNDLLTWLGMRLWNFGGRVTVINTSWYLQEM